MRRGWKSRLRPLRSDARQVALDDGHVDLGYAVHVVVDDDGFVPPVSSRVTFVKLEEQAITR